MIKMNEYTEKLLTQVLTEDSKNLKILKLQMNELRLQMIKLKQKFKQMEKKINLLEINKNGS